MLTSAQDRITDTTQSSHRGRRFGAVGLTGAHEREYDGAEADRRGDEDRGVRRPGPSFVLGALLGRAGVQRPDQQPRPRHRDERRDRPRGHGREQRLPRERDSGAGEDPDAERRETRRADRTMARWLSCARSTPPGGAGAPLLVWGM